MKKKKLRKKIKRIAEGIEQGKQIEDPREAIYVQIDFLKKNIEKLKHVKNDPDTQFAYGEKTAYLDCYDFFEIYRDAEECGWDPSRTEIPIESEKDICIALPGGFPAGVFAPRKK